MAGDGPRVIINDRALRNLRTGVGHYVAELIAGIRGQDPDIHLLPFYQTCRRLLGRPLPGYGGAVPPAGDPRPAGGATPRRPPDALRRIAQDLYHLAFETAGHLGGYHLYHEPNHIPGPWHGPILTTVHDLSVLRHPEWHPADRVAWYEREFAAALPRSDHFITVSEFTKREMIELLHVEPARITAIPLGARSIFRPRPVEQVRKWLHGRGLPEGSVLYVGTIEPRKNLPGVVAAYARLPATLRQQFPLMIAGMTGWAGEPLDLLIRRHNLQDTVRPLGYVDDEDLALLYNAARVLIWPSFYEGFGLPPLESMASGTPVIAARTASIPEIVGDAGILVVPHDERGLAEALACVLEDEELAGDLAQRGLERSRRFSWSRCAAEHARLYRRFSM